MKVDLFTLLRQAAKDGIGYVNLPLVDRLEAEAARAKQGWCSACGCDTDRLAKDVARILSEHGLHVSSPDEGDLDDVERERWNACVEIVKALRG